jgi:hypothetical protein
VQSCDQVGDVVGLHEYARHVDIAPRRHAK